MRIKRLKLVGFKSFVEPAELRIETGLTGIVGPNGCGKSNLLEAIRWVMGESSAKSMRGAGMEDVIFAGTASRPPRDFAEVTISAEREIAEAANDEDHELEVTRRIERGAGSAYRSNGRDVRAKDVALIFADAATGAHSPALVSQGRIGAIISAKPQERRQMLEEAAGISGLHVRRKDAEQKLRAAETNLARLATILTDMDARAGQLRRQAKQAERYRKLSKDILQAEARLIFVRWQEAKAAADAARAEANAASEAVSKATVVQRELTEKQQTAVRELAEARSVAMAARDAASDLSNRLVQLTGERDRIIQRQADLSAQAARMADDGAREGKLTHDAADALARLQAESVTLAGQIKVQEEERPSLIRMAENAERQVRESEVALAKAAAEQARADAELRVADAALAHARARAERAERDAQRLAHEQDSFGDETELKAEKIRAAEAVATLQRQIENGRAAIEAADVRRTDLTSERDVAQSALASAKAELAALISEQNALERALAKGSGDKAIDRIKVEPGYERALAAALGDDANAAIGGERGRRWTKATRHPELVSGSISPPHLSVAAEEWMLKQVQHDGVERLLSFVDAPKELGFRLAATLVMDADDGRGARHWTAARHPRWQLRRWDGFVADDDGATTAERLIRANRLSELIELIAPAETALTAQADMLEQLAANIALAQEEYRTASSAQQAREGDLRQALRAADQAEDALSRLQNARAALAERIAASEQELAAAKADVVTAEAARNALPDGSHHADLVEKLSTESEAVRQLLVRSQADLSSLDQRLSQTRERRAVAMAEIRGWQDRAGEAERRIAEMNKRASEIAAEQEAMAGRPDILASEIATLQADKDQWAKSWRNCRWRRQPAKLR